MNTKLDNIFKTVNAMTFSHRHSVRKNGPLHEFCPKVHEKPLLGQMPFLRLISKVHLMFYHVKIFKDMTTIDNKIAPYYC